MIRRASPRHLPAGGPGGFLCEEGMSDRKRVFSGIQPTGNVHIGNYVGAGRNYVALQEEYDTIYCVVDLHAMTVPYDPAELQQGRIETAKMLLAMGVDPTDPCSTTKARSHSTLSWPGSSAPSPGWANSSG